MARQCKLIPERVAKRIRAWVPETPSLSRLPMHPSGHLEPDVSGLVVAPATDHRHCRACGRPVEIGQTVVQFVYWPWVDTRYGMPGGIPPTVLIHRGACPYAAAHRTEEVLGVRAH